MSVQTTSRRVTVTTLRKMKREGEKIACLTAYDASFSAVLDSAGIDVILVGDSLGMVVQGHSTTVPVKVDDMVYHSRAVASRCNHALLMVDMPFMSYTSTQQALDSAAKLMQDGAGQMVKLEGDSRQVETVEKLVEHGVPVCAHIGLQPQQINKLGGYRVQGRGDDQARKMIDDALALEQAGADLMLLECVVEPVAAELTRKLTIPTIGIGASAVCDGQILVLQDILGITPGNAPKFSHNFLQQGGDIQSAVEAYVAAVKNGEFPANEHIFET